MNLPAEYQRDFYGWIAHHVALLKQGRLAEIDVANLIEELESMGKRDRHELESHLVILLIHLLKWQFQFHRLAENWREFEGKSWRNSIVEQREQIERQMQLSPSLKPALPETVREAYPRAVKLAHQETGLAKSTFPASCPYTLQQLLDDDFFPDAEAP